MPQRPETLRQPSGLRALRPLGRAWLCAVAASGLLALSAAPAAAQTQTAPAPAKAVKVDPRFVAPGFTGLPRDAHVALMPIDVELFELTAGGTLEPKADWTAAAQSNLNAALQQATQSWGSRAHRVTEQEADAFAEQIALQEAVSAAISLHHVGMFKLPSKDNKLDWTVGNAYQPIAAKTGARYGLFFWLRDSYASAGRKAAMVGLALLGVGIGGGVQVGYASLVDLQTGQVLWFNQLVSAFGDVREPAPAKATMESMLSNLPVAR